jgi:predicted nucleic acid-binding protein
LDRHEADLVVNPVILGEIRFGILLLPTGQKRRRLERWFQEGLAGLPCLPWDLPTGLRWAELLAQLRQTGRSMPVKDSLIAATALVHDLHVASRNRQDFAKTGVDLVNPFLA